MNDWHRRVLQRRIPRLLKQPNGIARAVRLMVALQRELANTNTGIGTDAMAGHHPENESTTDADVQRRGNATIGTGACEFHYYDTNGYDYRQLGPHVAGGGTAWGDFIATADPNNPDNQTVSLRVLKWSTPPPTMPADES